MFWYQWKTKDLKPEEILTEQAVYICNYCFILGFLDDYLQP